MASIKKRFYNGSEYFLDEHSQTLRLSNEYHQKLLDESNKWTRFKKIGGSSLGDVFETDAFKSRFKAFCFISRLSMPALQMKYINAGVQLEPKVIDFLRTKLPKVEIQHIEAEKCGYDYFQDDRIIGGVPDGLIPQVKTVLELKAVGAKKEASWLDSKMPEDYKKQAQLYAYLLGYTHYALVGTFLNEEDYYDTNRVNFNKQTQMFTFQVNKAVAEDDINEIKKFWLEYTQKGVSPQYKLPRDTDLVDYLRCRNEQEWEALFNKWKILKKVDEDIKFE
ncbi:MAGa7180 family putative nuclease [Mycoplasmopsis iners]|uniref:MAGa7180 family putative nuclease n=1 Tax=Mycoplasmopsis iners TaxID=76630 RepID=UPI000495BB9A|nr:hypothetical protein [Mycoplasmopsis iners]